MFYVSTDQMLCREFVCSRERSPFGQIASKRFDKCQEECIRIWVFRWRNFAGRSGNANGIVFIAANQRCLENRISRDRVV